MSEKLSPSQRANKLNRARRRHLRRQLEAGKIPVLRKPLPGAVDIYLEHGILPKIDVYVPDAITDKKQDLKNRAHFKYERRKQIRETKDAPGLKEILQKNLKRAMTS